MSCSFASLCRLASSRDLRDSSGLFLVDGLRFVAEALTSPLFQVEAVFVAPDLLTHPFGNTLLRRAHRRALPVLSLSAPSFRRISRQEDPQGIGAVVRQRWDRLERIRPEGLWLALGSLRSPGNFGTILRTLEAFSGAGLLLLDDSLDPFAPEVVRAAMGATFRLRFVRTTQDALEGWRLRHEATLVGTSPSAERSLAGYRFPERSVVWMGPERTGLSADDLRGCDVSVRIPMEGRADSLNVAVATAIVLYEIARQRQG